MRKALVIVTLLASFLFVQAQDYLDGREVILLANESRYNEAFELARSRPATYGQWAALMVWHRIVPSAYSYSKIEGLLRGYAEACQHMGVNKEAEAFCYRGIIDAENWKSNPEVSSLLKEIKLPKIGFQDAQQGLMRLEKEGVPYAILVNQVVRYLVSRDPAYWAEGRKEARLRPLAESNPYSLGGALAAGLWAETLWEDQQYSKALQLAKPLAGIIATAGSVVAWAEFTGQGISQNKENACQRAHFWTRRSNAAPAVYTLGLCYLEGAGGFPKDPVEAYALFWLGDYLGSRYPGFKQSLKELEASLTPAEIREGRQRVNRYLQ